MTDWTWDETLYVGAAPHYARSRTPYARNLAPVLNQELRLDNVGRLLDIGCGPGPVSIRLAGCVESVVGVDQDPGMLDEAAVQAELKGVGNATWVHVRAEDLPAGLGQFRVVTFGQSFHWMDRRRVVEAVYGMLEPEGFLAKVGFARNWVGDRDRLPEPPIPRPEIDSLVHKYLGPGRRAGQNTLAAPVEHGYGVGPDASIRHEDIIASFPFVGPEKISIQSDEVVVRSVEDVVSLCLSNSASAPHLFGSQLATFTDELRAILSEQSPSGYFAELAPPTEVFVWQRS